MKNARGDLLALAKSGQFDVSAHGCNCFCGMGNGIAGQIKKQVPAARRLPATEATSSSS